MGRDLLIATAAIPKGKKPDWDKAEAAIKSATNLYEEFGGAYLDAMGDDPESDEMLRDWLKSLVSAAEDAWNQDSRSSFVSNYVVPGWSVWIAGGDSWGDTPCEEFDIINNLLNTGLATEAGFVTDGF